MATRVFDVGQAPTYGSGWSTVGQAIDSGLQSVLGYYQEYTKQKRFEEQQKQEAKLRAQEMAERKQQNEDARNQRRALFATQKAQLLDPSNPNALPDEFVDVKTVPDEITSVPSGPEAPTFTTKQVRTPKTFVEYGDYVAPLDFGGKQAAAAKKAEKEYEHTLRMEELGSKPRAAVQHIQDPVTGEIWGLDEETGKFTKPLGKVHVKEPAMSASDKKTAREDAEAEMIANVREGDPESIPVRYRALAIQRAEGRGVVPRGGSNNIVDALAAAYNGTQDQSNIKARAGLRSELVKGSPSARGGQVTRINQFAGHLNDLQDASEELNKHLANSDWQFINYLDQKLTRAGKKAPIRAYEQWADTVINEYIATVKGGTPTNQDTAMFQTLRDTTTAPQERQAIIDAMKLAIEERANDQESVWKQTFGKPSTDSGQPMFNENYRYDPSTGTWRHQRRGVMQGAAGTAGPGGAPKDPAGLGL
jgi:hypothetical protein